MRTVSRLAQCRTVREPETRFSFRRSYGDLGAQCAPEQSCDIPVVSFTDADPERLFDGCGPERQAAAAMHFSAAPACRALVFRDSFMTDLAPYLARSFSDTLMLGSTARLMLDAVDERQADLVITEVAERRLLAWSSDHSVERHDWLYLSDSSSELGRGLLRALTLLRTGPAEAAALVRAQAAACLAEPVHALSAALVLEAAGDFAQAARQAQACLTARPGDSVVLAVRARITLAQLCNRPFYGLPYISFDGSRITVVGSHLPPDGDPSAPGVAFGPGVSYSFNYPLASTGWEGRFWHWPNARLSDFQLVIDLSASLTGSDPFHVRFTYPESLTRDFPRPYGEVWLPRDLGSYVGFPVDPTQLTRVQCRTDQLSVTMTGYNAFRTIAALLARYGVGAKGTRLMDWGCGHGRVCRHFIREWPRASIIGMDIDAENVAWGTANLHGGRFATSPLLPPCELEDGCLDALFSISVMTHLPAAVQQQWLAELARLIRPGGIALMSFGGPAAVAWASVWHPAAYLEKWRRQGIHDELIDPALDGKIADATDYRNTAQSHAHVRATWQEHFEVLDILPEALGNLDFAVLKRR